MMSKYKLYYFFFGLILLCSFPGISQVKFNQAEKLSEDLKNRMRNDDNIDVLIYFKNQQHLSGISKGSKKEKGNFVFNKLVNHASQTQKEVSEYLLRSCIAYKPFYIINAISTQLSIVDINRISLFSEVDWIAYDSPVHHSRRVEDSPESSRAGEPEWGLQIIQADHVWELGIDGEGAVVGGQDTGYDWTHPALMEKYRGYTDEDNIDHNYNWHDAIHEISPLHNDSIVEPGNNPCGLDIDFPCDDGSHGTHTMGTMVGRTDDNIIGVAPGAKWIGVRNMERGWGKPSTYLEGFEWFLAPTDLNGENPDPSKAPHVINNSWSCPLVEGCDASNWEYLDMAINNLRNAGIVVVVSASNNGNNCGRINAPPGMFEGTFAVAATRIADTLDGEFIDKIASYSSWGPVMVDSSFRMKPDISAPGSSVRSSKPNNKYGVSSGTSMAGPHVAGVVALLISANPDLAGQVDDIEEIIQLTAEQKTKADTCGDFTATSIPNFIYGYGRINAMKAVLAALQYTSTKDQSNIDNKTLVLYPNPGSDHLIFDWKSNEEEVAVKFISASGIDVFHTYVRKGERISISHLSDGMYFVRLILNDKIVSKAFIKGSTN